MLKGANIILTEEPSLETNLTDSNNSILLINKNNNYLNKKITFYINKQITPFQLENALKDTLAKLHFKLMRKANYYIIKKIEPYRYIINLNYITSTSIINFLKKLADKDTHIYMLGEKSIAVYTYKPNNISFIKRIIQLYDKPPEVYNLEVTILDIDTMYLSKLGIDINVNKNIILTSDRINILENISLYAQREHTKIKLIAKPKLLLTENKTNIFIEGFKYPIRKETIATDKNGNIQKIVGYEYKTIGLKLEVKLLKAKNGKLLINLRLDDTRVLEYNKESITTTERKIITTLFIPAGKKIAIAGVGRDTKRKIIKKVPILGDIPIIKYFFTYKEEKTENRTLIIILKVNRDLFAN